MAGKAVHMASAGGKPRHNFRVRMQRLGIWFKGGTVALSEHDARERAALRARGFHVEEPPTPQAPMTEAEFFAAAKKLRAMRNGTTPGDAEGRSSGSKPSGKTH